MEMNPPSTRSGSPGASFTTDASLLRRALRLVHCLQKERGASCAHYCAFHDAYFTGEMLAARGNTDVAALRLFSSCTKGLVKIRQHLDTEGGARQVHRILVMFNTLISNVVHTYIFQYIAKIQKKDGLVKKGGLLSRTLSDAHLSSKAKEKSGAPMLAPPPPTTELAFSSHASSAPDWALSCSLPVRAPSEHLLTSFAPGTPPSILQSPSIPGSPRTPSSLRMRTKTNSSNNVLFEEPQDRLGSLLNLLGCLVKVKESSGTERAALCSMLVLSRIDQHLLTALVLEAENHRKLVSQLKHLPMFDFSLQKLVQDGVVMGPEMTRLQTKIVRDFDLDGMLQEMTTAEVWDFFTIYTDRLHSLELLLVEEIECCNPDGGNFLTMDHKSDWVHDVFGGIASHQVQDMPPEMVKDSILHWMSRHHMLDSTRAPPPPPLDVGIGAEVGGLAQALEKESAKEWEIDVNELQFQKRIGRGSAGTTYLGKWSGQKVAVKVAAVTEMGLDGWRTEMQALQRLHHPNIIRLLGSVYNPSPVTYCLVLEYCNAGNLAAALQMPTPANFFLSVATDIANGMAYLHNRGVIHRDIKPGNVLLDGDVKTGKFSAKVADFGVAKTFEGSANQTAETGTYRWMAPEVIRHESYSIMADVYSFAILAWQLVTREIPFQSLSSLEAAGRVAIEFARPPFPKDTPNAVEALISKCWSEDPSDRLPFAEISSHLSSLETMLPEDDLRWLSQSMGHAVYKPVIAPPALSSNIGPSKRSSDKKKMEKLDTSHVERKPPVGGMFGKHTDKRSSGGRRSIFGKMKSKSMQL